MRDSGGGSNNIFYPTRDNPDQPIGRPTPHPNVTPAPFNYGDWPCGTDQPRQPDKPDFSAIFRHMPRMPRMPKMPDYTKLYKEQQAAAEKAAGIRDRDTMYREYLSAADDAISFIDAQIGKEQATANLMGVDYDITDEERQQRISDYFASIWSEGHQSQLEELMKKWGNPTGFKEFTVVRGDPSNSGRDTGEMEKDTIATSQGQKPLPFQLIDEEDSIGKSKSKLNLLNL